MSIQLSANKRCLSAPDTTSLHHCPQNHRQYYTILKGFLMYMPSHFYSASVVLFQLHGGMVSHMQALATPDPPQLYTILLIGIFYSQIVESSSLVSVLFQEAISHPYIFFFHLLVNVFSVTSFRTFSKNPYLYYTGGRYRWAGRIKMVSPKNNQLISSQGPHFSPRSTAKTNDKRYKSQEEWHLLV